MRATRFRWFFVFAFSALKAHSTGVTEYVKTTCGAGDFKLVCEGVAADIYVASSEPVAVQRAAKDLAADIQRVTGKLPAIKSSATGLSSHAIVVGTVDNSPLIKSLESSGKLDLSQVSGKWETFQIQTLSAPIAGVDMGLVIVGSDRRATSYGVYDVSERMGVSPWYWFADVPVQAQTNLAVTAGTSVRRSPSVKFRGIFINDEDFGIKPWANKTYGKADGQNGIGPTTYHRVFELMLRLKANYLWPAMHGNFTPFNYYPANKLVADSFAIFMGSSHHEPMLRNPTANNEWAKEGVGEFNYQTNATNVYKFWEKRVIENGKFENIYTLGKRGSEDAGMPEYANGTMAQKVGILQTIIADQRKMLAEHVDKDVTKIPQIFIPYKEVLSIYYGGLKVPEDVMLGWVDDNQGYIRSLPDAAERARSGGSGVYYHLSYWGWQDTYLWLTSIPPSLVWEEMNKAWEYQARKVWIVNVGDIKPAEISTELFLDMAWDVTQWNATNVKSRMERVLTRDFGAAFAPEIADIMEDYYRLNFSRKPELMDTTLITVPFNLDEFGDEAQLRIDAYVALEKRASAVNAALPASLKDAFYQMVLYQVRCSMLQNQKMLYAQKSRTYAKQGRASAATYANLSKAAYAAITTETNYYNNTMAGGKWKYMMSTTPTYFGHGLSAPIVNTFAGSGTATLNVRCQGGSATALSTLSAYDRDSAFIDLYSTGAGTVSWTAKTSAAWLKIDKPSGSFSGDTRLWVSVNWSTVPVGSAVSGSIEFTGAGATRNVTVSVFHPQSPARDKVDGFVESKGYVSMEAEHFSRSVGRQSAAWKAVKGLGRTGDGMTVFPTTLAPVATATAIQNSSPAMEYDFHAFSKGTAKVTVYCLPNQSVGRDDVIRYAVSVDDGTPSIVNVGAGAGVGMWTTNVNRSAAIGTTSLSIPTDGKHVLKVWFVDPGLVVDKIVIDYGGAKNTYFGPPESFSNGVVSSIGHSTPQPHNLLDVPALQRKGSALVLSNPSGKECMVRVYDVSGTPVWGKIVSADGERLAVPYLGSRPLVYRIAWEGGQVGGQLAPF